MRCTDGEEYKSERVVLVCYKPFDLSGSVLCIAISLIGCYSNLQSSLKRTGLQRSQVAHSTAQN